MFLASYVLSVASRARRVSVISRWPMLLSSWHAHEADISRKVPLLTLLHMYPPRTFELCFILQQQSYLVDYCCVYMLLPPNPIAFVTRLDRTSERDNCTLLQRGLCYPNLNTFSVCFLEHSFSREQGGCGPFQQIRTEDQKSRPER